MQNTNHLQVGKLSKTYRRGVKALNGLSFEAHNGIFGLLGPNGAGKSTLMRTIAGLQEPDEGQVHFNGVDILAEPQFIRNQLGYLPQDFGVYPGMSTWQLMEHLAILKGIHQHGERNDQIEQLLQHTNLWEYRKKAVSTFSGGMRQRFGVAQALLGNPQLVIVDEPTAGLDPEERNRFLDLLSELGEEKIVILSTHIVEDVRDLCQQVAIIHKGSLVEQGEPDILIERIKGKVWRKIMEKQLDFELGPDQYLLSSRLFAGKRRVHVLADRWPGEAFESVEPSLEDVYFSTFQEVPIHS
ncbi:MAG: ABC transporter ATP-binding protein [Saprospiraceae bacterium]|nr:ABC transporter ATP-binding protein [Saprospiraceae bacterium]